MMVWLVFAIDYVVEFLIAPDRVRYLRTHLLALTSIVLPLVRILEVARFLALVRPTLLVRILIITDRATLSARELLREYRFGYVAAFVSIVAVVGAAAEFFFESTVPNTQFPTYGDALWWAAALLTTINIGREPITAEGRIVALVMRLVALGLIAYLTGALTSYLVGRAPSRRPVQRSVAEFRRDLEEFRAALVEFETALQEQAEEPGRKPPGRGGEEARDE